MKTKLVGIFVFTLLIAATLQSISGSFPVVNSKSSSVKGLESSEDTIPSKTNHTTNPSVPNGDNGWFVSAIKVTISATDDDSGVAWTNYSLNNGISWVTHYGPDPFYFVIGEGDGT